jgi:hypothetical protein
VCDALLISKFNTYQTIHDYVEEHSKIFILLGEGKHKIKKKAEQVACQKIIEVFNKL